MQLKMANNELTQVRQDLAEQKSKNAKLTLEKEEIMKRQATTTTRSGANTPTRTRDVAAAAAADSLSQQQPRNLSPPRASNLAIDATGNNSALKRYPTPDQSKKNVSFSTSPSVSLPHPSQHVPLVWNSSIIQQQQQSSQVRGGPVVVTPGRTSPSVSFAKRNSPGRIQRRDMQF
jgi:hypothetical protein